MKTENVAVIGASDKPERYSYKAMRMLEDHGHKALLVHPNLKKVEGHKVYKTMNDIPESIDTITLYISPPLQKGLSDQILKTSAKRVIFNPGTENPELEQELEKQGIKAMRACTLVLLSTDQF